MDDTGPMVIGLLSPSMFVAKGASPTQYNINCLLENLDFAEKKLIEFAAAGCNLLVAPTGQANISLLEDKGLAAQEEEIIQTLCALALRHKQAGVQIGGALSSTGLLCEPYGETKFNQLIGIYKQQISLLRKNGMEFILLQAMQSLTETRAAIFAARFYKMPVLVTFSPPTLLQQANTIEFIPALVAVQHLHVYGVGMLGGIPPQEMLPLMAEASSIAQTRLIAIPDAGNPNPVRAGEYDLSPEEGRRQMELLTEAGAHIIGMYNGCSGEHIAQMRKVPAPSGQNRPEGNTEEEKQLLSNGQQLFFLHDAIEMTEPIEPVFDMTEHFIRAEENGKDVLCVALNNMDDGYVFSQSSRLCRLPVCFHSDNEDFLMNGLLHFQGRAMVDSNCDIDDEKLNQIAAHFGALVY